MPFDIIIALIAVAIGAILQVGIGIGFSIVAGPILMLQLGTPMAVPLLLLLNTTVSVVASPGSMARKDHKIIATIFYRMSDRDRIGYTCLSISIRSQRFGNNGHIVTDRCSGNPCPDAYNKPKSVYADIGSVRACDSMGSDARPVNGTGIYVVGLLRRASAQNDTTGCIGGLWDCIYAACGYGLGQDNTVPRSFSHFACVNNR